MPTSRSIRGRYLVLTSTNGLGQYVGSTGGDSTAVTVVAQMWGKGLTLTTTSTGDATLPNSGISVINTSATAAAFLLAAPVAGVMKQIFIVSSASALTFGGTSTSQVFMKIAGGSAGSTTLTLTDANLAGQALNLTGLSTTQWGVMHGSTVMQA